MHNRTSVCVGEAVSKVDRIVVMRAGVHPWQHMIVTGYAFWHAMHPISPVEEDVLAATEPATVP